MSAARWLLCARAKHLRTTRICQALQPLIPSGVYTKVSLTCWPMHTVPSNSHIRLLTSPNHLWQKGSRPLTPNDKYLHRPAACSPSRTPAPAPTHTQTHTHTRTQAHMSTRTQWQTGTQLSASTKAVPHPHPSHPAAPRPPAARCQTGRSAS